MIGLEYIIKETNCSYASIAGELGINRSNVTKWATGKLGIPKKYMSYFSEKFNIPEEYFSMEVNELTKREIRGIILKNEFSYEEIDDAFENEDGEIINCTRKVETSGSDKIMFLNESETAIYKSLKKLETLVNIVEKDDLDEQIELNFEYGNVINLFASIIEERKIPLSNIQRVLNSVLLYLDEEKRKKYFMFGKDKFIEKLINTYEEEVIEK